MGGLLGRLLGRPLGRQRRCPPGGGLALRGQPGGLPALLMGQQRVRLGRGEAGPHGRELAGDIGRGDTGPLPGVGRPGGGRRVGLAVGRRGGDA